MKNFDKKAIMRNAWMFVKSYGFTLSEALKKAWANAKVVVKMHMGIVKFYFQKVDGTLREAWGTLKESLVPSTNGGRKQVESCQVYYDTEKMDWRCYKKVNLVGIA